MKKMSLILKISAMIFAGAFLFSLNCRAQALSDVQNSFNNHRQSALQEKIFVHTDKSAYLTGEIMWFKLYVVDGTFHKPLNLSKVAYVEVLDNNQNPVMQAKVALWNGSGSGSIYIPVTLSNGNYKFRAYTNWMKNFSPDFYFEKCITIVNPLKSPDALTKTASAPADVQFFPEGGDLVNGITSEVAFKATGSEGKGVDCTGEIVDQKNDTIVKFKPLMFGMGHFSFTPDINNTYKAVIQTSNGTITKNLPAIKQQGYVMHLSDDGSGQLQVSVTTNISNVYPDVYLFTHTGGTVKDVQRGILTGGKTTFTVSRNALGEGISHITVFDNEHHPVCERLYFKRPADTLTIAAASDQQQYANRKKVTVTIAAKDKSGAADANLSMSVYRLDDYQVKDPANIAAYLWLNSDLKGYIQSPEYYLQNGSPEASEAADNLMLTQGWSRFEWDDLLKNASPAFTFLPEYNGHIITGKITDLTTNKPAGNVVTYLGIPGKMVQLYVAKSDTNGRLLFNTKNFYGPGEIVVQTNTEHDSTYRIDIQSPFSEQYSKIRLPAFNLNKDMQPLLELHSLGMQVLNIYSSDDIRRIYDPGIDSSAFFGKPYKTYKLDDYTRFTTMEEVLREYVSEVYVLHPKNQYHIEVIGERGFLNGDPLVMLDGIPIFNINKVIAIDPLKVKRLDVIRSRYYYGPADAEGILSYTTYKGDLGGVELDPHAVVLDYEGMQLHRVFYSPVYGTESEADSRIPDFRNTLYWAPTIRTSAQGNKEVSFYTSDQPGTYIGIIQGMTASGQAGSKSFTFEVKK